MSNSFKYCKEIKYINAVNCPVDLTFRSSLGTLLKMVSIVCGVVKHSHMHFIIVLSKFHLLQYLERYLTGSAYNTQHIPARSRLKFELTG